MMRSPKLARPASLLIAVLVAGVTLVCAKRAFAAVTTANASLIQYNLAAGAISGAIVPVPSQSVLLMGVCNTLGDRGTGHVSLLRVSGSFLEWVGLNSPAAATITSGFSAVAGTNIVQIDFAGSVVIEVNTADTFRIHNAAAAARVGNVTMVW